MTFDQLKQTVDYIQRSLIENGFSKNDRIALVLPNGPEMAVAFLGVSTVAISAPLNPAYQVPEFEFYLSNLRAKALICLSGVQTAALDVARSLHIRLLPLTPKLTEPAGVFHFSGDTAPKLPAARSYMENPEDIALALYTSGTTSRPKIVPLTQHNLCCSAENICASLKLTPADRCLNIMPLFHIHGLIGAVLASVMAGASVVCTPGFDEKNFYTWLDEFQPSWFTAVPSIHHAILAGARSHEEVIRRRPLRFLRSCSAPLPPKLMAEAEQTFSAPVLEAYGMTEASHQIASNPLPPLPRKAGSVGIPTGPQVAVMDEAGNLLRPRATGEIVIRGASVTGGYENSPAANRKAFTKGWFRTGDQGWIDDDGYVYLTGRLKELINRGGEKISPREVDETLLEHPAVDQAVTFAIPHPRLGEDIAVAIVLKSGTTATEKELRQYAARYLADYKVPRRIIFVNEIAKGASGKLQRIGLARTLSNLLKAEFVPPRNPGEEALARIWCDVLGIAKVGVHDNFFDLGGDSLLLIALVARICETYDRDFPIEVAFNEPTVAGMAKHI
jgi:acyl-CoA synthetase (AMP-forming)/AMP-acid ligase II/acyl carrier protein